MLWEYDSAILEATSFSLANHRSGTTSVWISPAPKSAKWFARAPRQRQHNVFLGQSINVKVDCAAARARTRWTRFFPRCQTHTPDANRAFTEQPDQSSFVPCTSQACGFRNSGSRPKLVWPQVHRKKWHTRTQQTVTAAAGLCWQIEPASCVATEYGTSPCLFSAEFFLCVKKLACDSGEHD